MQICKTLKYFPMCLNSKVLTTSLCATKYTLTILVSFGQLDKNNEIS